MEHGRSGDSMSSEPPPASNHFLRFILGNWDFESLIGLEFSSETHPRFNVAERGIPI